MNGRRSTLAEVVPAFEGIRVLVVGEAMLDTYLEGGVTGVCREAPVPVVEVAEQRDLPGGAANAAANASGLGADVRFLSVVGDDAEAVLLRDALERNGVPSGDLLVAPRRRTLAKGRVVGAGQIVVRFDRGTTQRLGHGVERRFAERLRALAHGADAILVSDYDYGVLTPGVREALAEVARVRPTILVVDAKDASAYRHVRPTAVKPNYQEAARLLGLADPPRREEGSSPWERYGDEILERTGAEIAAVTLDTDGAIVFERGRPAYRTYARPARNADAAGAGDTFASTFTLALAAHAETSAAADLASAAAAVVVARHGTRVCAAEALREAVAGGGKELGDASRLAARMRLYRDEGRRIVFANGCFDILHQGHIACLSRAKSLGDVLVVAVNTDDSVRRLKGPGRPINPLADRMQVLAALSCVDHVVPFDEETPARLIAVARPDVFVKGGDYTVETLPEANLVEELGGEVQIVPHVEDRSTTSVIERVRARRERPAAAPALR